MEVCYYSNRGFVRKKNEDSLLIGDMMINEGDMSTPEIEILEGENTVIAIADGMGGQSTGDIASRLVLGTFVGKSNKFTREGEVKKAMKAAKKCLDDFAQEHPSSLNMGTTLSGLSFCGGKGYVFHIGDSRVYLYESGRMTKLTTDHTMVQHVFSNSPDCDEIIRKHPMRNILTSCLLGNRERVLEEYVLKKIKIKKDDIFFLCTDGVWELLSKDEMEEIFFGMENLKNIGKKLVEKIYDISNDNMSFIIVRV